MRKLLLMVCALFGFMACTQNPIEEQSAIRTDAPETIRVGFEDDETRIQLNEAQKTVWTKGDQVSVFYKSDANQKWEYRGETGERVAELYRVDAGTASSKMNYVVLAYPYSTDYVLSTASGNIEATLPATQHYAEGSYGVGNNLMVSQSEFTQFSLKSVCGWLKLQLTGDGEVVKSIKFRGNDGEQVAGLIYVDTATAEATLASEMGSSDDNNAGGNLVFDDTILTEVVLDCGEGVELGAEATSFYIALPPQTFANGFTVEINCWGYQPMNISTSNAISIERNHIQPMTSVEFDAEVRTIANNEIWYTSTEKIERSWTFETFEANIVSHDWDKATGEGIIAFDRDISIIGNYAFDNCDCLKTVSFNNNIKSIGDYAFAGCDLLSQVVIPGNIEEVGYKSFENCSSVSSIIIESGDTEFWDAYSFDGIPSTSLYVDRDISGRYNYSPFENVGITTITIGPNMKNINMFVFSNCKNIQGFNIDRNSQLESIGYFAFYNSTITGLHIPNSVTNIDSTAFAMTSGMSWFTSDSIYGVGMNGELYGYDESLKTLLRWPDKFSYSSVVISSNREYKKIGAYSFSGIDDLRYVQVVIYDDTTIEIDDAAFWNCINLEEFEAGFGGKMNISAIGATVFGFTSIKELNFLDSSFNSINGTFRNCLELETLYLPTTLTQIGERTFENCSKLTSIFITSTVPPSLSADAFNVISNELSIYIPAESVEAYKNAENWSEYSDRLVAYDFENSVVVTPKPANNEIWYTNGSTTEATTPYYTNAFGANIVSNTYDAAKECWVIKFDSEVTRIGERAFDNCSNLTSVTIPNSVTEIRDAAFEDCYGLTSITIPDSVTSIGNEAFYFCSNLTSVTIPDSVTTIGGAAFTDCRSLTSITIPNSVTTIRDNVFYCCFSLTSVTIPDSVITIGNYAFAYCNSLTSVTIPDSVTTIGHYAFYECTSLTSVTIPDSVTSIGNNAFYSCLSLTSVTIPDSVTEIEDSAFAHCSSLTSVNIPDSVTTIGNYAFYDCNKLTSVNISDRVTSIGEWTFANCFSLTSVTIPDSITTIGNYAFDYCRSLTSVTIPDSVTSIGNYAFYGCSSLTSVTIPDSVTTIGNYAFGWCTSLTSVTIGNSVSTIGSSAFEYCKSLTSVYCKATTPPAGDDDIFRKIASGCKFYVPMESVEAYKSASVWSSYWAYIVGYNF